MHGSEAAIDGSNLPFSYVCLPLNNPIKVARKLRKEIINRIGKHVTVLIVDTDKTYSFRNFHFTPRPNPISGIHSFGGFFAYIIGRSLKLKKRATPVAISEKNANVEVIIEMAKIANRIRGFGSGRTVWDMAKTFHTPLTGVSWEMLKTVKHKPIVIIRKKKLFN